MTVKQIIESMLKIKNAGINCYMLTSQILLFTRKCEEVNKKVMKTVNIGAEKLYIF